MDKINEMNSITRENLQFNAGRNRRTMCLLNRMRGLKDEFAMLKGVLCMDHQQSIEDSKIIDNCFDNLLIANRLDEMNRIALAEFDAAAKVEQPHLGG